MHAKAGTQNFRLAESTCAPTRTTAPLSTRSHLSRLNTQPRATHTRNPLTDGGRHNGTTIRLFVFMYFDPRQEVALADADDEPEVKAFFGWISSLLDTGSAIGTAFDTSAEVETSLGGGRIYALTQNGRRYDRFEVHTYATRSFTDSAQLEYYGIPV